MPLTGGTSHAVVGHEESWPTVSMVQLNDVGSSHVFYDTSNPGYPAVYDGTLPSAYLISPNWSNHETKICDVGCQTTISWLGRDMEYIYDKSKLVERKVGIAGRISSIQSKTEMVADIKNSDDIAVIDVDAIESTESQDSAADNEPVMDCYDLDYDIERNSDYSCVTDDDTDLIRPVIEVTSEAGAGILMQNKHVMNLPRDPRQTHQPDAHWARNVNGYDVHCTFNTGSLVWAKIYKFPWWPAVVVRDPVKQQYFCCKFNKSKVSHYYVSFFDEKVSHAWVPVTGIRFYRGPEQIQTTRYAARLKRAMSKADDASSMTCQDRSTVYQIQIKAGKKGRKRAKFVE